MSADVVDGRGALARAVALAGVVDTALNIDQRLQASLAWTAIAKVMHETGLVVTFNQDGERVAVREYEVMNAAAPTSAPLPEPGT